MILLRANSKKKLSWHVHLYLHFGICEAIWPEGIHFPLWYFHCVELDRTTSIMTLYLVFGLRPFSVYCNVGNIRLWRKSNYNNLVLWCEYFLLWYWTEICFYLIKKIIGVKFWMKNGANRANTYDKLMNIIYKLQWIFYPYTHNFVLLFTGSIHIIMEKSWYTWIIWYMQVCVHWRRRSLLQQCGHLIAGVWYLFFTKYVRRAK